MGRNLPATIILALTFLSTHLMFGQAKTGDELFRKVRQIKLFETTQKEVESQLKYSSFKESKEAGVWAIDYEVKRARLTVYYSVGRCSEHNSGLAYDAEKGVVVGVDLFYYDEKKLSDFDFEIERFRKHVDSEGNAVIFTNEEEGIQLTGGEKSLRTVEFSPSEKEEEKYRCRAASN